MEYKDDALTVEKNVFYTKFYIQKNHKDSVPNIHPQNTENSKTLKRRIPRPFYRKAFLRLANPTNWWRPHKILQTIIICIKLSKDNETHASKYSSNQKAQKWNIQW